MSRKIGAGGGRRSLSDDEHALWTEVTRAVAPLPRARKKKAAQAEAPPPKAPPAKAPPAKQTRVRAVPPPRVEPPAPKPQPALAPLGTRFKRKLARGNELIDDRIDLHGMTQAQAHSALTRFLHRAQSNDARNVLVITGKGKRGDDGERERGVLRRQVPQWLRLPELRGIVVGFEEAAIGHGGEGALYVRVRRIRGPHD